MMSASKHAVLLLQRNNIAKMRSTQFRSFFLCTRIYLRECFPPRTTECEQTMARLLYANLVFLKRCAGALLLNVANSIALKTAPNTPFRVRQEIQIWARVYFLIAGSCPIKKVHSHFPAHCRNVCADIAFHLRIKYGLLLPADLICSNFCSVSHSPIALARVHSHMG